MIPCCAAPCSLLSLNLLSENSGVSALYTLLKLREARLPSAPDNSVSEALPSRSRMNVGSRTDGTCGAAFTLASCAGTVFSTRTLSRCSANEVDNMVQFSRSNEEEKKTKGRSDESTPEITSGQKLPGTSWEGATHPCDGRA